MVRSIETYMTTAEPLADATGPVQRALEEIRLAGEKTTLLFPRGEYHFYKENAQVRQYHTSNTDTLSYPDKTIGILLEGQRDLTIDGDGSVFIFHGNMMALAVVDSVNIELKNFSWDYPCAPTQEMVIKEINANRVIYQMPEQQTFDVVGNHLVWYEDSPITGVRYWQFQDDEKACNVMVYEPTERRIARHDLHESPFVGVVGISREEEGRSVCITYTGELPAFYQEGEIGRAHV